MHVVDQRGRALQNMVDMLHDALNSTFKYMRNLNWNPAYARQDALHAWQPAPVGRG